MSPGLDLECTLRTEWMFGTEKTLICPISCVRIVSFELLKCCVFKKSFQFVSLNEIANYLFKNLAGLKITLAQMEFDETLSFSQTNEIWGECLESIMFAILPLVAFNQV